MEEAISLGWNCHSAWYGVSTGLRNTKENGYKTCPFDEMITNYKGIIDCINDDFRDLCDSKYLQLINIPKESKWLNTNGNGDMVIYNKKYKFIFNHESPGHGNFYINQKWQNGINHYLNNDYEELIKRYKRRIQNIKELLNSNKIITFILTRPDTELIEIDELKNIILSKYPLLNFKFLILNYDKKIFYDHLLLMKIDENDDEIKRLNV